MAPLRATLLAFLAALAAPVGAHASLLLDHDSTVVAEQGPGDGLVGPGDAISLTETLLSSETQLTGLLGRLSSSTPGVSVTRTAASFPDVAFGNTTTNTPDYLATIAPSVECGENLSFTLDVDADQGSQSIPITVGTGVAGVMRTTASVDVPRAIPDGSAVSSSVQIAQPGRVKDLRVDIGRITHGYDGDLKIWIEAPDHTIVVLVDRQGGSGDNFDDTVFSLTGASTASGAAPFTGTFRAAGDLTRLVGHAMQGTWTLHVSDEQLGDSGTLVSWGLRIAGAACDGNPIPSFTATPNPAAPGSTVNFDAAGSTDPNGTIVKYEWDLDGDGSYETDTGTTAAASHVYPARAAVEVGLRVTDDQANTATTTVALAVTQPPTAAFGWTPTTPSTGADVTFDASASADPDGSIVRYEWDLDGNGTFERDTQTTPTTIASFATPGAHTVRLRVTDDNGAKAVHATDVGIANRAPTARIVGPDPPIAGVAALLDASSSSDPDGGVVRYEWDLDGNGSYETDTGPGATITQTWPTPGARTVGVRVTDGSNATDTAALALVVDAPPLPALAIGPNPALVGQPVIFTALATSDPDGTVVRYEWDLDGDGSFETDSGTTAGAVRAYAAPGTWTVRLRVTDDRGAQATITGTMTVNAPVTAGGGDGGSDPGGSTGGGDPGGGSGGGTGNDGGSGTAPFTAGLLGAPIQGLRLARRHGITLICRVAAEARCTLTVRLPGREARKLRLARTARSRIVGRAVVTARPGADARVVLALSKPLRRALRRVKATRLMVRGSAVDALGRRVTLARVVLLRR